MIIPHPQDLQCFYCTDHPLADPKCAACQADGGSAYNWLTHIGPDIYLYCPKHRIRSYVGSNLLSTWKHQTEDQWSRRWRWLQLYDEVEVYGIYSSDAPASVMRMIEAAMGGGA